MQYKYTPEEVLYDLSQAVEYPLTIKSIKLERLVELRTDDIKAYGELEQIVLTNIDTIADLNLSCFAKLEEIIIHNVNIHKLADLGLKGMDNLKTLSAISCGLTGKVDVSYLSCITEINLSKNNIHEVVLPKTSNTLQSIYLKENNIHEFPSAVVAYQHLAYLYLCNNNIKKIVNFENPLPSLRTLSVQDNLLTSIAYELKGLVNLDTLFLGNNAIQSIDYLPTKLTGLWLSKNNLSRAPRNLNQLYHLEKLTLSLNTLVSISLENLSSLKEVTLVSCGLDTLPTGLGHLHQLEKLDISDNPFALENDCSIENASSIENENTITLTNPKLQELNMNGCFTVAKQNLSLNITSPHINVLELCNCKIANLHLYHPLSSVTHLNLSFNQLKQVPDCLSDMENIAYLDLSENQLAAFNTKTDSKFPDLIHLNLNANNIRDIPSHIACFETLEVIDLSENHIKKIDFSLFRALKHLQSVDVSHNPLVNQATVEEMADLACEIYV